MSASTIELVVPCLSFGVRARFAAADGLTRVELITLRAVAAGVDEVPALESFLGLGARPVLDLIHDLWLKGHLVVDAHEARVRLSSKAQRAQASGALDQLATSEKNIEIIPLMQDLLSGSILPLMGRARPAGPRSQLVPTERSRLVLDEVSPNTLLQAAQQQVERRRRNSDDSDAAALQVVEAWLEPEQLITGALPGASFQPGARYLHLQAEVRQDADSQRLDFQIRDPDLPTAVRRAIGRALSALADRLPDHLFFKQLREKGKEREAQPNRAALDELTRKLKGLEALNPGLIEVTQESLATLLAEAAADRDDRRRQQASVRLLEGIEAQEGLIRQMLSEAEHQVVIGNPWVRTEALLRRLPGGEESWLDLLRGALARGVQVVLLWGIRRDSRLDEAVSNALYDLQARHPGRLIFSARATALHGKFVIGDARWALVTSYNFLDPAKEPAFELGLCVESVEPRVAPEAVLALLDCARRLFPEYELGRQILCLPTELGRAEALAPAPPSPPEKPGVTAPEIRHWAHCWQAQVDELVLSMSSLGTRVELVTDQTHAHLLWRALHEAGRRLVVVSDRLSTDVVTDRFVARLRERLEAGTPCQLIFRREGASDLVEGPAARVFALQLEYEKLSLHEAESHAKLLISDDEVLLGSFNFLSFGGVYRAGRRERAELSLRVVDELVAAEVQALLHRHWPARGMPAAAHPPGLEVLPASSSLQPLFRALQATQQPGLILQSWFERTTHPWQDLEALQQAGVDGALLQRAAGAAIAKAEALGAEAAYWQSWLAEQLWQKRDFIGAALIRPALGPCAVPGALARLGAAVQAGLAPELEEIAEADAKAALCLALVGLLAQGQVEYLDVLDLIEERLDAQARAWRAAVRAYWQAANQQLPLGLLQRRVDEIKQLHDVREARQTAEQMVDRAWHLNFNFVLGEKTWSLLRKPDRLLGRLQGFVRENQPAEASDYLDGVSVEALLDEASDEMRTAHHGEIIATKRKVCISRLQAAVDAVQAWVKQARPLARTRADDQLLEACQNLSAGLAGLDWAELGPVGDPAHLFLLDRLALLFAMEAG